jgi:3-oxoacyl-[acyl-carrier protein] reductase
MLLKGKNAIVTGCNRGIGRVIVETLAHNGANIWACARKPSDVFSTFIESLKAETNARIDPIYFDLADTAQIKNGIKTITAAKLPIDILVNNAGAIFTAPFIMTTEDKMREQFDVNFFAPIILSQYIARTMARQKSGSIINISSSAAIEGNEGRIAYASAKAALITATKVMSRELGALNIRVNAIAPGLTQTDMMTGSTAQDALDKTVDRLALKRVGRPEEIANTVLYLASDLSSYMTGQVLSVDGGM